MVLTEECFWLCKKAQVRAGRRRGSWVGQSLGAGPPACAGPLQTPRRTMAVSVGRLEESLLYGKSVDRWKEQPTAAHAGEDLPWGSRTWDSPIRLAVWRVSPRDSLASPSSALGFQVDTNLLSFLCVWWELNSDHPECTANTLPTELSLQPPTSFSDVHAEIHLRCVRTNPGKMKQSLNSLQLGGWVCRHVHA